MNALALAKLACAAHATIVLLPQFSARAYIEAIGGYRASFLTAVPPMIAMMLREAELLARTDLSSVAFMADHRQRARPRRHAGHRTGAVAGDFKTPAADETKKITQYCFEHGLITITAARTPT